MEMGGQFHDLSNLPPRKSPPVHVIWEVGKPQNQSGLVAKERTHLLPGVELLSLNPQECRFYWTASEYGPMAFIFNMKMNLPVS
jgi:hypothetical protein